MIPPAFDYMAPATLKEALEILSERGDDAKVLTGGHSLIPLLKLRLAAPALIVDLRRIDELRGIEADGDGLRIGALVTHREVAESDLVRSRAPLIAETAEAIGDVQVRNMGTLCGSIAHADPAADYPAALLALDAEVEIAGPQGGRTVALDDFLVGLLTTALEPGEIIKAVRIPRAAPATAAYRKMRQSASGFALAGVAAQLELRDGKIARAAIGVTGIADRAYRAREAEAALAGSEPAEDRVAAAVRGIASGRDLLSDIHASADFRAHLAEVLAKRAVLAAAAR